MTSLSFLFNFLVFFIFFYSRKKQSLFTVSNARLDEGRSAVDVLKMTDCVESYVEFSDLLPAVPLSSLLYVFMILLARTARMADKNAIECF